MIIRYQHRGNASTPAQTFLTSVADVETWMKEIERSAARDRMNWHTMPVTSYRDDGSLIIVDMEDIAGWDETDLEWTEKGWAAAA